MKSNKKRIVVVFAILTMALVLSFVFVACDKAGTDKTGTDIAADYKVTIHPNNGQSDIVWDITKEIPTITKDGFHIAGYFLDAQLTISTTLESLKATGITKNIDVYVKWEEDVCEHVEVTDAAVAPTCTEKGRTEGKHCSKCGKILQAQTEIPALGHDLEHHDGQEATCTEKGWKAYDTCKRDGCTYTTYKEIPALGHTGGTATCTEQATCERCNEKYGSALGHKYGDLIPKTEPTCSATGVEEHYKCSACDKVFKNDEHKTETTLDDLTIAINPDAHNFGEWIKNEGADTHTRVCSFNSEHTETENCHGGTATCTEQAVCEKCNAKYGKALGHDYQNGVCNHCGDELASEGLKYSLNSDGNGYTVTGIGSCTDTELVIPSKHNSKPVTSIGDYAFKSIRLTSVTIPNSLTSIGSNPFGFGLMNVYYTGDIAGWCKISGLVNLFLLSDPTLTIYIGGNKVEGDLIIPRGVTSIGEGAFCGCTGLTSVTIGNGVTSIGEGAFAGCTGLTSITIPDSVMSIGDYAFIGCTGLTSVTIGNGVTSIGDYAFRDCTGLTSITIPDSVTSIGYSAFKGCTGLTSIDIPDSVTSIGDYAFYDTTWYNNQPDGPVYAGKVAYKYKGTMSSNTSIVLKEGTLGIADTAFRDCTGLTSITIPNSVTSIGYGAFYGCTGLTSIIVDEGNTKYHSAGNCLIETESKTLILGCKNSIIPTDGSVTSIGDYAFKGCTGLTSVTIPDSVTSIGSSVFNGCTGLTTITGPSTVASTVVKQCGSKSFEVVITSGTSIGFGAFYGCTELTSITIPDSVTSIGSYAFAGCTGLTSITIPDSVMSIGDYAFIGCTGLTSVTIGNGVTSIGSYAFSGCTGLMSVTVADGNTKYHSSGNCLIETASKTLILGCNTSVIPNDGSVTSIGDGAFYGCTGLASVTIPDSVTSIGYQAFSYCSELTSVTIPDSVTSIGSSAFSGCTGLTSITIPDHVTNIGNDAFEGCTGLTSITIPDSVTSIGDHAFNNCTGLTSITIPNSVKSIGSYAFSGCTGLTSITIPDHVTSIGGCAFSGCTGLTSITIPDSVTSIGSSAFYGCTGLTSVTIGNSVTSIGYDAFSGCNKLQDIYITDIAAWCNISGLSNLMEYGASNKKLYINNELATSITIPNGVTAIPSYAFYNYSGLTSITIPDSVTSIGEEAFNGCSSLESITIPFVGAKAGVTSNDTYQYPFGYIFGTSSYDGGVATEQYYYGSSTSSTTNTTYYIPSSLKSVAVTGGNILYGAFAGCTGLTSVTIPDSVTSIGEEAFAGCYRLIEVYNKSTLSITAGSSSNGEVAYYAKNVYTTEGGSKLTTDENGYVIYTDGDEKILVAYLGTETELALPSGITQIHNCAFCECTGLTSVTIGNSVTSIGWYAFYNCTGLTSITIPDSVTSIGEGAFYNCTGLTSIIVNEGNTKYHSEGNCLIETATKTLILGCKTSVIPAEGSVTSIGDSAFSGCRGLTSITIPDSVTSIGDYAFVGCTGLMSVTVADGNTKYHSSGNCLIETASKTLILGCNTSVIPNDGSVTSIGDGAFYGCTGLASVTIPDSVTSIGYQAFAGCTGLTSITIGNGVTSIGLFAFSGCTGLTSIKFNGTIAQWNAISKGSFWKRNVPSACKVICTDGTTSI